MHKAMPREYLGGLKPVLKKKKKKRSSHFSKNEMPPWMIASRFDMENVENGSLADRGKPAERSMEDLAKSSSSSGSYGMTRAARALTVR